MDNNNTLVGMGCLVVLFCNVVAVVVGLLVGSQYGVVYGIAAGLSVIGLFLLYWMEGINRAIRRP